MTFKIDMGRKLTDDETLALESEMLLRHIDRYIVKNYGPRCDEHEDGCPVCDMYKSRDMICERIA